MYMELSVFIFLHAYELSWFSDPSPKSNSRAGIATSQNYEKRERPRTPYYQAIGTLDGGASVTQPVINDRWEGICIQAYVRG